MPVSFDWEFEEEENDSQHLHDEGRRAKGSRRWLFRSAVLFTLFAILGLVGRAWLNNRVAALKRADEELQSVIELELKTIADSDAELFRGRQDPDDAQWRARQSTQYIYRADSFPPVPGLIPADRPPEIDQVYVLGRTGRAELTHWFTAAPSQSGDPLPFHVTWFYRQDEDGVWYHVAPPDGYWGAAYSWYGSWLVIRATEAEADLLDPMARDLSELVARGCLYLECRRRVRNVLSFEGELAPRERDNWWTLPALYLTGMPGNGEARAAWERGLKRWMVEALVRTRLDARRFGNRVIYGQLVTRLQAELGLSLDAEAEPTASDVGVLAEALLADRQHTFQGLWESEYEPGKLEEMRLLETEVAFLLDWIEDQVGDERLFDLLPAMQSYMRLDTALLATYHLTPFDFESAWLDHLIEMTGVVPPASAVPFGTARFQPPSMQLSALAPNANRLP